MLHGKPTPLEGVVRHPFQNDLPPQPPHLHFASFSSYVFLYATTVASHDTASSTRIIYLPAPAKHLNLSNPQSTTGLIMPPHGALSTLFTDLHARYLKIELT